MSTTPAFSSPAFTKMFGPVVGNFFSSRREFLYEQCSLHITEKIPSSVKFGSRPRIFLMRSNSSGVSPCCLTSSGVTAGSAVGDLLVIEGCKVTNPEERSIAQIKFSSNRHIAEASGNSSNYEHWVSVLTGGRHPWLRKQLSLSLACSLHRRRLRRRLQDARLR